MSREDIKLRVREILARKGMDCTTLAEKMGKAPQYVNNVLNKRKDMSLNALICIADALGVEFGDLFISSFTPKEEGGDDFSATVKCCKGVFTASSVEGLQDIVDILSNRSANLADLTKRTLERVLRFPANGDMGITTEIMANLSRCMDPKDWRYYYHQTIKPLLPPNFTPDYNRLRTFMSNAEVESFSRALM